MMDKYINSYYKIIKEENNNIINESFGKWMKNVFTKFGKNAVNEELQKTFDNVITKFKFKPDNTNGQTNVNVLSKIEGNYIIQLDLDPANDNFKSQQIGITVLDKGAKTPVKGLDKKIIKMRHSWTEDELTDEINKAIRPVRIKLTETEGSLDSSSSQNNNSNKRKKHNKKKNFKNNGSENGNNENNTDDSDSLNSKKEKLNQSKNTQDKTDQSSNQDQNNNTNEKNEKSNNSQNKDSQTNIENSDLKLDFDDLKTTFKKQEGDEKSKKISMKTFVNGWKKLSPEEKGLLNKIRTNYTKEQKERFLKGRQSK